MMLFVNGCSHTAGSEIDFHMQPECKEKAWPKKLADMNNWDIVNIAHPGASNERIRRTTVEWFIKNTQLQKNYDIDDIVVMLMWSGFERFEEWNSRVKAFISSQSDSFLDEKLPEFKEYAKLKTIINTWASNQYKNLVDVYMTAIFLENLGIKYYFLNGVQSWSTREKFINTGMINEYDTIYRGYGEDRIARHLGFHNENDLPKHRLKDIPANNHAKWDHWTEEGHLVWAGIVQEWMKSV